jgi:hypothetical protein
MDADAGDGSFVLGRALSVGSSGDVAMPEPGSPEGAATSGAAVPGRAQAANPVAVAASAAKPRRWRRFIVSGMAGTTQ